MNFSLTQTSSKTGFLKSKDDTPLFYRQFPLTDYKARVLLVHGYGEHSGRYLHVIDRLLKDNFEVIGLDLRGHGYSEGRRGDICTFESYEDDVIAGLEYAAKTLVPNKKLFVLAHSMGALVSLRAVARRRLPIDGMVLSCPLLRLNISMPSWKKWASFAAATLVPKFRISSGIKGRHLSHDQLMAKAYDADPLVLKNISIRTFWEIFKSYQETAASAAAVPHPFLMQVGGKDRVVCPDSAQQWFKRVGKNRIDASLKIYPDFLHEIYNEAERHVPIEDAVAWLNSRV